MPDVQTLSLFLTAAISLMLTPGPAKLYLIGVSVGSGRSSGALIAMGIFTSDVIHVAVASLGAQVVFERFPTLFDALRYGGAAYLLYLAYASLRRALSNSELTVSDIDHNQRTLRFFVSGVFVNLFNPLAVVFYLSLLPQFVNMNSGVPQGAQMFGLGLAMVTSFLAFHLLIAGASSELNRRVASGQGSSFAKYQAVVVSIVFLALAVRLVGQSG